MQHNADLPRLLQCCSACLQVDLLTFKNVTIGQAVFAAMYGTNMQLAALFATLSNALTPLLLGDSSGQRRLLQQASLSADLQQQLAAQLWSSVAATNGTNATDLLADPAALQTMLNQTYAGLAGSYPAAPSFGISQLSALFEVVSKVSGARWQECSSTCQA